MLRKITWTHTGFPTMNMFCRSELFHQTSVMRYKDGWSKKNVSTKFLLMLTQQLFSITAYSLLKSMQSSLPGTKFVEFYSEEELHLRLMITFLLNESVIILVHSKSKVSIGKSASIGISFLGTSKYRQQGDRISKVFQFVLRHQLA